MRYHVSFSGTYKPGLTCSGDINQSNFITSAQYIKQGEQKTFRIRIGPNTLSELKICTLEMEKDGERTHAKQITIEVE